MAAKVCRLVLIAASLVVRSAAFGEGTAVAGCPTPGTTDPVDLKKQVTCVDPNDVTPTLTPHGHIDASLRQGISAAGLTCAENSGKIVWPVAAATTPGTPGSRPYLQRGGDLCYLKAISLKKLSATAASTFWDYGDCAGGGLSTMATVEIKLQKVTSGADPVSAFVERLCRKEFSGQQEVAKVKLTATEKLLGAGKCDAATLANYSTIATSADCQQLCVLDIEKFSPACQSDGANAIACMNKNADLCRGYSYSATDKKCITYKGTEDIKTTVSGSGDYECRQMELETSDFGSQVAQTTTAPPIRLTGTQTATKGVVRTYSSKGKCFPQFDWITLQDAAGNDATLKVLDTQWDSLMELFVSESTAAKRQLRSLTATGNVEASLQVDHVTYGANTAALATAPVVTPPPTMAAPVLKAAPSTTMAVVTAAPVVVTETSDCSVPEFLNALLSGAAVPILVWGAVYAVWDRRGKKPLGSAESSVYVLILVSFVAALVVSLILVFLVAFILKPICDSSANDMRIVTIAVCIATACGCAIGLYFMGAKGHGASSAQNKAKYAIVALNDDGSHKIMEHNDMVQPHEHDALTSTMATGRK
jgi:hypothetical protein